MENILTTIDIITKMKLRLENIMGSFRGELVGDITDDILVKLLNQKGVDMTLRNIETIVNNAIDNPQILGMLITRDNNGVYKLASDTDNSYTLFHLLVSNELVLRRVNRKDSKRIEDGWKMVLELINKLVQQRKISDIKNVFDIKDKVGYFPLTYYDPTVRSTGNMILNSIAAIPYWYIFTTKKYREETYINDRIDLENRVFSLIIKIIDQLLDSGLELEDIKKLVVTPTEYVWGGEEDSSRHLLGFLVRTGYENYALEIINMLTIGIKEVVFYRNFIDTISKSLHTTKYNNENMELLNWIGNSDINNEDKNIIKKNIETGTPIDLDREITRLRTTYKDPYEFRLVDEDKFNKQTELDRYEFKAFRNIMDKTSTSLFREFTDMWRAKEKSTIEMLVDRTRFLDYDTLSAIQLQLYNNIDIQIDIDRYEGLRTKFINFLKLFI